MDAVMVPFWKYMAISEKRSVVINFTLPARPLAPRAVARECLGEAVGFLPVVFSTEHTCHNGYLRAWRNKLTHQLAGEAAIQPWLDANDTRSTTFGSVG